MLTLDGAKGEGGGQIVRTALFLSLLLRQPVHIDRIRAGREKPGLKPQHATILRLLAQMTGSKVDGGEIGSPSLTFEPGRLQAGSFSADIGTAGCIPLLLQTILPVAVATPGTTKVAVRGGTHVPFGPTMDWLGQAYLPYLRRLADVTVSIERVGFAPEGGGHVTVEVRQDHPAADTADGLRAWVREHLGQRRIEQGAIARTGIRSIAAGLPNVPQRQAFAALAEMTSLGKTPAVEAVAVTADGKGSAVTGWVEDTNGNRLASDRLGHLRTTAESVGKIAGANLVEDWKAGATVDRHLADHLAPWVALGAGAVRVPQESLHLRTTAWVCNQFLGDNAVRIDRNLLR
ncbi:MAG TPA: RNA 3'-terminal phosphate cyclase [Candidatus Thermoplasmatota archaeon]|nr:RNA 3'-terminal phosphate cyclase [Candidatus Thermoplasmatota archaeon]